MLHGGTVSVEGDEDRALTFAEIANLVYANNAALPPELADRVTLNHRYVYRPPFGVPDWRTKTGHLTLTYASQFHVCVLAIEEATGKTEVLDYAIVDECGTPINPQIVEGQVHGAAAHGIAAVLQETLEYDERGQLLNGDLLGLPRDLLPGHADVQDRQPAAALALHPDRLEGDGGGRRRAAARGLLGAAGRARPRRRRRRLAQPDRAGLAHAGRAARAAARPRSPRARPARDEGRRDGRARRAAGAVLAVLRDPRRFVAALPNVDELDFEPGEDGSFRAKIRPAIALGELPIETLWRPRSDRRERPAPGLAYAMEGGTGEHRVALEATVTLRDARRERRRRAGRAGRGSDLAEWTVEFEVTGTMRSAGQRTIAAIVAAQAEAVLRAAASQATAA